MIPRRRSLLPIAQRHFQIIVVVRRALPSPPGDVSRVLFDERAIVLPLSFSAVSRCIRFWWCIFRKMQFVIADAAAVEVGTFVPRARVPPGYEGRWRLGFLQSAFGRWSGRTYSLLDFQWNLWFLIAILTSTVFPELRSGQMSQCRFGLDSGK